MRTVTLLQQHLGRDVVGRADSAVAQVAVSVCGPRGHNDAGGAAAAAAAAAGVGADVAVLLRGRDMTILRFDCLSCVGDGDDERGTN